MQKQYISNASPETITLVHSGEDYFSRLERIILEAKTEIHIQTYIFENDTIGKKIIEALKKAASRNVKIYILIDGFGSFSFPRELMTDLRQNGINFRLFSPFFSANSLYIGRRLHHKIVVADSEIALIGGINIADKYLGTATKTPWLDYAVQINDMKIAKSLSKICLDIYFRKRRVNRKKITSVFQNFEEVTVNILQNDWLKRKSEISNTYIKSFLKAKEEIVIVGSYFLPGRRLITALKKASKNNVKIKLILSGISDLPMARRASCYLYSKLLRYNIELYEWKKSVLHGKAAVIDNQWTTIGSFNLNNLSSYASIEMNVGINSVEFSKKFLLHLNEIMFQCEKTTPESLKLKNRLTSRFVNWVSYWIIRFIEIIITYLPHKRFKKLY
ncbi:MAG: phospholipase D-like domain-containing protein [Flavobacterium sp.]|uniref:phospholipase D-like domain-containing protein n=1 Tax=Flavobacterium sp. TaxID=239 RepID=UPI002606CE49|nr:phospholipase D-like domain-containing protein [Flavobacterium sp.]MDD5149168.1 phospholipase D-like domain-containing protein [Flavobacterium sp.]